MKNYLIDIRFYDSLGSSVIMGTTGRVINKNLYLHKLGDLFLPLRFLFLISDFYLNDDVSNY